MKQNYNIFVWEIIREPTKVRCVSEFAKGQWQLYFWLSSRSKPSMPLLLTKLWTESFIISYFLSCSSTARKRSGFALKLNKWSVRFSLIYLHFVRVSIQVKSLQKTFWFKTDLFFSPSAENCTRSSHRPSPWGWVCLRCFISPSCDGAGPGRAPGAGHPALTKPVWLGWKDQSAKQSLQPNTLTAHLNPARSLHCLK